MALVGSLFGRRTSGVSRLRTLSILGILILAASFIAYQYGMYLAREGYWHLRRGWALANGQLVDLGGYRLYISCRGSGTPVVVMDAGLGNSNKTWNDVTPDIAAFTRVCAYDRRGVGLSDGLPVGTKTRTADDAVADLRLLLDRYQVPPPYVLVGHSTGGFHVRLFANHFPNEVAGLVLVDSSHENQFEQFARSLNDDERRQYLSRESGGNLERLNLVESANQLRRARDLPAVPLFVLSATVEETPDSSHAELQADLARLRPDSRHVVVPGAGHFIQNDAPAVVVESIRNLVDDLRSRRPQPR